MLFVKAMKRMTKSCLVIPEMSIVTIIDDLIDKGVLLLSEYTCIQKLIEVRFLYLANNT